MPILSGSLSLVKAFGTALAHPWATASMDPNETYRGVQTRDKDPRRERATGGGTGDIEQLRWSFRFFCQILKGQPFGHTADPT